MEELAEQLAAALSALLSLNRTQGVTDDEYEDAEDRATEALARYDAERDKYRCGNG